VYYLCVDFKQKTIDYEQNSKNYEEVKDLLHRGYEPQTNYFIDPKTKYFMTSHHIYKGVPKSYIKMYCYQIKGKTVKPIAIMPDNSSPIGKYKEQWDTMQRITQQYNLVNIRDLIFISKPNFDKIIIYKNEIYFDSTINKISHVFNFSLIVSSTFLSDKNKMELLTNYLQAIKFLTNKQAVSFLRKTTQLPYFKNELKINY